MPDQSLFQHSSQIDKEIAEGTGVGRGSTARHSWYSKLPTDGFATRIPPKRVKTYLRQQKATLVELCLSLAAHPCFHHHVLDVEHVPMGTGYFFPQNPSAILKESILVLTNLIATGLIAVWKLRGIFGECDGSLMDGSYSRVTARYQERFGKTLSRSSTTTRSPADEFMQDSSTFWSTCSKQWRIGKARNSCAFSRKKWLPRSPRACHLFNPQTNSSRQASRFSIRALMIFPGSPKSFRLLG